MSRPTRPAAGILRMASHPLLHRREFLQVGASSLVGLGLPALLAGREAAPAALPGRSRSVILLLLTGGASHLDNVLARRAWPCCAAGLGFVRPRHDGIPSGVTLPHALIEGPLTWPGQHGGFLGASLDPLLVTQDPSAPNFRMEAVSLPDGL